MDREYDSKESFWNSEQKQQQKKDIIWFPSISWMIQNLQI